MKIKFLTPSSLEKNLKATVHRSGKLGFTIELAKKMDLSTDKSISIGINEEEEEDKNLYILVNSDKRSDAFSVLKAGDYYYVNLKALFDNLKYDYENRSISFDVVEEDLGGVDVFVFKFKQKERMNK